MPPPPRLGAVLPLMCSRSAWPCRSWRCRRRRWRLACVLPVTVRSVIVSVPALLTPPPLPAALPPVIVSPEIAADAPELMLNSPARVVAADREQVRAGAADRGGGRVGQRELAAGQGDGLRRVEQAGEDDRVGPAAGVGVEDGLAQRAGAAVGGGVDLELLFIGADVGVAQCARPRWSVFPSRSVAVATVAPPDPTPVICDTFVAAREPPNVIV